MTCPIPCLILLLLFSAGVTFAQSVRVLSTKDGLPQSFVSGLAQDNAGFVWIGTRNGLSRFDGQQYKVFQHDPHDTTTVASNLIIWMFRDVNNNIWIEYESREIDRVDPVTEKIEHFITRHSGSGQPVNFIRKGWLVDSSGLFWGIVRNHGLNVYDEKKHSIQSYDAAKSGFFSDTLRGLLEDKKKNIWVLSQKGISKFQRSNKQFIHYKVPYQMDFSSSFYYDQEVADLHERKNGELMWGDRYALYFFNPVTQSFRSVPFHTMFGTCVRWIKTAPDGLEYFEINGDVYHYDEINSIKKIGSAQLNNPDDARSFMVDKSGLIWVGTNADGIHQIDLVTPFFVSYPQVKRFPEDLLRQELKISMADIFNWTESDQSFSSPGYHFRSVKDNEKDLLYMGLKETVAVYNCKEHKITTLPHVPVQPDSRNAGIGIKGITLTPDGKIIVLGFKGQIVIYDEVNKSWRQFIDSDIIRKTIDEDFSPLDILADKDKLWITTANDGLLYIDIETKQLHQLKAGTDKGDLPTDQLLALMKDPAREEIMWIGSYQGLISFNKKTFKSEVFSTPEGLSDNTVYSILSDSSGNLWLSTNKGLCRLNPITRQIRVFRASYGLPGDEFNRFHQLQLPDGKLAFGGTAGWTLFDPLTFKNDDYEPKICLTSLKLNNTLVNENAQSAELPGPLNSLSKLVLQFSDNTIALGFAGMEFNQPQDLIYRYQLKGYDDGWIMAGHFPVASYTKVPPGNYTLLLNASNTNGKWSRYVKSIEINIRPPWWRMWWAYVCYAIVLIALVWGYIDFRINSGILRQEMQLKEKEAAQLREIDEMKTTFFSNITHEFRTPLTLILGPAEELKNRHPEDGQQFKLSDTIMKNAGHLLFLINQLMELAKLEGKAFKPKQKKGDIVSTVKAVLYSFENDAAAKKIQLQINSDLKDAHYVFAPEAVERIIYNLVSNAIRFTGSDGIISIQLTPMDGGIQMLVKDTGTGIAPENLPHIFDRFYQADNSDTKQHASDHKGTGIGLAIVKELVELEGGTIQVTSKQSSKESLVSGTTFLIYLPYLLADEQTIASEQLQEKENEFPDDLQNGSENSLQLLLAEDNAELAEFIKGSVQHLYNVTHISNGALAMEAALKIMPDVVVSDILMPVMDGIELCEKLKTDIRTSHIPVILLTAKASQDSRIEGLGKGADDYLTKPFHVTELLLRIRNLIEQRKRISEHVRGQLEAIVPVSAEQQKPIAEDEFINKVYALVEEHLDEPLFGVDQLLSLLDMSRTSLHRKIKMLANMSTTELVRNYRLRRAASFLQEGKSSTDTAYLSGFGSPSYFTKCFREHFGVTPGEFIERYKKT